jgi:hypothetical protein
MTKQIMVGPTGRAEKLVLPETADGQALIVGSWYVQPAQKVTIPLMRQDIQTGASSMGTVDYPPWDAYLLTVCRLSDAAIREYPQATHELALYALDPTLQPEPANRDSWRLLVPANVLIQFHGPTEQEIDELLMLAVRAMLHGLIPYEPGLYKDGQRLWLNGFRNTMDHVHNHEHAGVPVDQHGR